MKGTENTGKAGSLRQHSVALPCVWYKACPPVSIGGAMPFKGSRRSPGPSNVNSGRKRRERHAFSCAILKSGVNPGRDCKSGHDQNLAILAENATMKPFVR